MKVQLFKEIIERAIVDCFGDTCASQFDTVPYDDDGTCKTCLGVFVNETIHMTAVGAKAMQILQNHGQMADRTDLETAADDLVDMLKNVRVAPYMQWTCVYFPALTEGMVDTHEEEIE